jgi:TctA family transporter
VRAIAAFFFLLLKTIAVLHSHEGDGSQSRKNMMVLLISGVLGYLSYYGHPPSRYSSARVINH